MLDQFLSALLIYLSDYSTQELGSEATSLALLPGTEQTLVAQDNWSETRNINPYGVFTQPLPSVQIAPNVGRRGQTRIAVLGLNFTPGATTVQVDCDGRTVCENLQADAIGRVETAFTIPAYVRQGNRSVSMHDDNLHASTAIQINEPSVVSRVERVVEGRVIRSAVSQQVWNCTRQSSRVDPLAQTFSFDRNRVVSAIGLQFTQKDATLPVTVQIRGVTTGLPNNLVLAEKSLAPGEVNLYNETKVTFSNPFQAEADQSYAVVLLTHSNNYKVRVATLGQTGQNGVITSQTYAEGVLLESSNAETWTPLNGSDLAMRVYGYEFESGGTLQFLPVSGVQFSDLNLDEYSVIPQGCSLVWEYSTDGGLTWDAIVPAEEERLPNLAANVLVRVRMETGASHDTPALNFRDVNLIGYKNDTSGVYITRENELTQGVESTRVYAQMHVPSGTGVQWFVTNNGGFTWEPMSLDSTRPIDQDWTEYTYQRTFADSTGRKIRYKALLSGNALIFPRIHSLGATLS